MIAGERPFMVPMSPCPSTRGEQCAGKPWHVAIEGEALEPGRCDAPKHVSRGPNSMLAAFRKVLALNRPDFSEMAVGIALDDDKWVIEVFFRVPTEGGGNTYVIDAESLEVLKAIQWQ